MVSGLYNLPNFFSFALLYISRPQFPVDIESSVLDVNAQHDRRGQTGRVDRIKLFTVDWIRLECGEGGSCPIKTTARSIDVEARSPMGNYTSRYADTSLVIRPYANA